MPPSAATNHCAIAEELIPTVIINARRNFLTCESLPIGIGRLRVLA
jgi:hypothetical protein